MIKKQAVVFSDKSQVSSPIHRPNLTLTKGRTDQEQGFWSDQHML